MGSSPILSVMNNLAEVLNGGRRPGDGTEAVLWNSFKDVALFTTLKLLLNQDDDVDKESIKADIIDRWQDQCRLDFSRELSQTRDTLDDPDVIKEFTDKGLPKPNLGKVEAEFDIRLAKVRGMVVRVLDLL